MSIADLPKSYPRLSLKPAQAGTVWHRSPGSPWADHETTKLVTCSESFGGDAAECKQFCLCITKIPCLLTLRLILISLCPNNLYRSVKLAVFGCPRTVVSVDWSARPQLQKPRRFPQSQEITTDGQQRSCSLYEHVSTQSAGCPCLTRLYPSSLLS